MRTKLMQKRQQIKNLAKRAKKKLKRKSALTYRYQLVDGKFVPRTAIND